MQRCIEFILKQSFDRLIPPLPSVCGTKRDLKGKLRVKSRTSKAGVRNLSYGNGVGDPTFQLVDFAGCFPFPFAALGSFCLCGNYCYTGA